MKKTILYILIFSASVYSQDKFTGKKEVNVNENGVIKQKILLSPNSLNPAQIISNTEIRNSPVNSSNSFNNTNIKWEYTDPLSSGNFCYTSGNGKYNVLGWDLNNYRMSLYGNQNSDPLWEFPTPKFWIFKSYTSLSDTGGVIALGSSHNIYLFNNNSNIPFFNFDLTQKMRDTGIATYLQLTNDGSFLVCSASRLDSSTIFGFNSTSTIPRWSVKIIPSVKSQYWGADIQGVKLSGNDSIVIVNTFYEFYVLKTSTGELIFQGNINSAVPSNGTQTVQGISGDGSLIAIINYSGMLRVYKWNGTTYAVLWENYDPTLTYWYSSVDISYDGNFIAAGTLGNGGSVVVFKTQNMGIPEWTFEDCGDLVTAVSFSKSGSILAASSFGAYGNSTEDLYIFKTFLGNVPIYKLNTPGSLFWCSTSDDGRTVLATGKAVHAYKFGHGGLLFNIDVDTSDVPSSISQIGSNIVSEFRLYQNYPNPFNPVTNLEFGISDLGFVSLKIYDVLGKEVKTLVNEIISPGSYKVEFDGSNLNSGIYFYRLEAGDFVQTKRMVLIK